MTDEVTASEFAKQNGVRMPPRITRFLIKKLHGVRDVDIPIKDNRIVLAGANGLGKTTVVSIMYLYLSCQFHKLLAYQFSTVGAVIDGKEYFVSRKTLEKATDATKSWRHFMPPHLVKDLLRGRQDLFRRMLAADAGELRTLAHEAGIPYSLLERMLHEAPLEENKELQSLRERLSQLLSAQVLYLPTFRRIERDLKTIFPELEDDIKKFKERRSLEAARQQAEFVELVEFGMEDVETTIQAVRTDIKETARSELNALAGGYLRDVVRGEAGTYDHTVIRSLDDASIERILNRVEKTLDDKDKQRLRVVIDRIKGAEQGPVPESEAYVAHFFSKLLDIHKALSQKEERLTAFAEVCNKYLEGKRLVYDWRTYELTISLPSGAPIQLRDLSSGEKQIVSLFSHLHLKAARPFIILIDEPELSLSVSWQKMLLPDILDTGRVNFLGAVTHSPFTFDNELETATRDLRDLIREDASGHS